jgi:hypothetical protein
MPGGVTLSKVFLPFTWFLTTPGFLAVGYMADFTERGWVTDQPQRCG